jgi:hypothetical protein
MHGTIDIDRRLRMRVVGKLGPRLGGRARPPRRKRCGMHIRMPYTWMYRLTGASGVVRTLADHILRLDFETDQTPVTITTVAMTGLGLSTASKWRALNELERLGLIRVTRQNGKNPIVTIRIRR